MKDIYLDSSVIIRWVFQQAGALEMNRLGVDAITSTLAWTECWRSLDRKHLENALTLEEREERSEEYLRFFLKVRQLELTRGVLYRAATPIQSPLGTLGAIHLATALLWCESQGKDLLFGTHDRALARAARLHGFEVIGV